MLNKTAKIIKAFLGNFIFLNSVFVLFDMVKTEFQLVIYDYPKKIKLYLKKNTW
jgi:hypothetical protein